MSKLTLGGKITNNHSTLTEISEKILYEAVKSPYILKISISKIVHIGGGRQSIKFLPISGGVKAVIRGSGSVQDIYFYTDNKEKTKILLLKIFQTIQKIK